MGAQQDAIETSLERLQDKQRRGGRGGHAQRPGARGGGAEDRHQILSLDYEPVLFDRTSACQQSSLS